MKQLVGKMKTNKKIYFFHRNIIKWWHALPQDVLKTKWFKPRLNKSMEEKAIEGSCAQTCRYSLWLRKFRAGRIP